jgi:FAD/FMN-containing dehydrogenase
MTKRIDRREFLMRSASLAGAVAGGGLMTARGTQARPGGSKATGIEELAATLDGRVVLPHTPRYRAARLVWNSRYDDARPTAVIQVASAADVRKVVDFARERGRRLVARSGAHSFAGYSTGDGMVVDLSGLTAVEISGDGERARLGAGSTTLPTYRALWRHKKAISAGTCPTVGITGLTAGGGLGVLSRRHGLTCDNLLEVEIVTADGRRVRASERRHADLYWATRGGGGGNFGIITALTFGLVPVDMPFTHLEYEFPWSAAENVLAAWQDWLPTSPQATWSAVELLTQAPRDDALPTVALEVVHAGPQEEAEAIVADLLGAAGVAPTVAATETGPFVDLEHDFYCKGLRRKECKLADKTPAGVFPRTALYAKTDVASGPWPREGLATLIEWIERRQRDRTLTPRKFSSAHTIGKVLIEAADGAVNSIGPDATAFVHRNNLFVAQYQARWRRKSPRHVVDANLDWAHGLYAAVEPYRSAFGYQNYIDPDLKGWKHAYYGANLARLREVKSSYDPDDFFRFAQSIPPS